MCAVERQFVKAELDVHPFGVTVCEETDRVVVTCCNPPRNSEVSELSESNQIVIYNAADLTHLQTILLTGSYETPRCAIAIGCNFAVCHGSNTAGKVRVAR